MNNLLLAATDVSKNFVDIDVGTNAWIALGVIVIVLLGIDLYRHREAHEPTPREALIESSAWVACGLAFSIAVLVVWGTGAFGEYLAGYLVEKSLSVDNVFVWAILFSTLKIPLKYQHQVLFWGIFGALVLRAIFILAGAELFERFSWLLVVFGVFLIYTGVKVFRHRDDEGEDTSTRGAGLLARIMPVTDQLDGKKFTTMINGKKHATPLLTALVVIEFTDVVFAVDSVPAVLAVSKEPYIVFASNAFAILGLRAMYFLLAGARERFHYLSHALGAILVFVGIKMTVSIWYHFNTWVSLAIIVALLIAGIALSEVKARKEIAAAG